MDETHDVKRYPTHRAFVVKGEGAKKVWREIGAAWAHKNGNGYSVTLDALPPDGKFELLEYEHQEKGQ